RRYKNARRRARYWSGLPTFVPSKRSVKSDHSTLSEKYELAMCDCKNWEWEIERLTGVAPKHYDPKAKFALNFTRLIRRPIKRQRKAFVKRLKHDSNV